MLEQQQTQYLYISPERAQEILKDYKSFKEDYQEFCFADDETDACTSTDQKTTNARYVELANGMSQVSSLDVPLHLGMHGLGMKGRLKVLIMKVFNKFARPILKQALAQQQEMNRHTVILAQAVVALEARVSMLEHQLSSQNNPH